MIITDQGVFNFENRRKVQPIDETQSTKRVAEAGQDEIDETRRARNYSQLLKEIIMTTTFTKSVVSTLVLAMVALGAASSFAASSTAKGTEGEMLFAPAFTSKVTRDQVKAEYFQAAKTHQIVAATEGAVLAEPAFVSTRSVAEVRTEAVVAAHHPVIGTL